MAGRFGSKFKKRTSHTTSNINKSSSPTVSKPISQPKIKKSKPTPVRTTPRGSTLTSNVVNTLSNNPFTMKTAEAYESYDPNTATAEEGTKFTQEGYDPNIIPPVKGPIDDPNVDGNFTMPSEAVWWNPISWFGNTDFGEGSDPNYINKEVGATPPPDIETEVTWNDDELQPRTFTTPEPLPKVDYGDATPGGNASFSIKDYVKNEERTQDIWLHPNVSSEQHQAALDRQMEAKLANQIQRDYVASLRGGSFDQSGNLVKGKTMMPTQQGFDSFLDKIDTYNIPISEKAEITKHYNEKKDRLGSFDSSGMWEMGRTKSKNPNKAERLKIKAASGEKLSKKEKNYLAVVSGKNYVDDYGVALGMGQGINFTATDYAKMFEPGITKADIAKYNPDKPKPNWLGYEDL